MREILLALACATALICLPASMAVLVCLLSSLITHELERESGVYEQYKNNNQ